MSHWYSQSGLPCHTQLTKKGAKNPTRPTTLRDAMRDGLLPSVSGITDILSRPGLDSYKQRQLAEACFNNPPHPGEEKNGWISDMLLKGSKEGRDAADAGTKIHAGLEAFYTKQAWDAKEPLMLSSGVTVELGEMVFPAVQKVRELDLQIVESEKVLVNRWLGYAGTTDIIFNAPSVNPNSYGVLDFKSKKTTEGEPVTPYETQPAQIAAYIAAHWMMTPDINPFGSRSRGINLYISTTEPGRCDVVEYDSERLELEFEAFKHMLSLWKWLNKYNPAF